METILNNHFKKIRNIRLPLYRCDFQEYSLFYTPRFLVIVDTQNSDAFQAGLLNPSTAKLSSQLEILRIANENQITWVNLFSSEFHPNCLTLYLNNYCNLNCVYCYSAPLKVGAKDAYHLIKRIDLNSIMSAAKYILQNCKDSNVPMVVNFHGGGEPVLDWRYIDTILEVINHLASSQHVELKTYIATNAVMSLEQAKWLISRFDNIGISCDGPSFIQSVQRPLINGEDSSKIAYETMQLIQESGKSFDVRVTLTSKFFRIQSKIAEFFCGSFKPNVINVEPVYKGGRTKNNSFSHEDAVIFTEGFIKAEKIAGKHGVTWATSGSRMDQVHGAYCNIFRNVLQIGPNNTSSICFKDLADFSDKTIGSLNPSTKIYYVDHAKVHELKRRYQRPSKCYDCFINLNCTHGCPNNCLIENDFTDEFLCEVLQKITYIHLTELADNLTQVNKGFEVLEAQLER